MAPLIFCQVISIAHLFVEVSRSGNSQGTFSVFELATIITSNLTRQQVGAIPLSILPKDTTSKLSDLFSQYHFNAERQAGKLQIPTF